MLEKKQKYLNMLDKILAMPNSNLKLKMFFKVYNSYCQYCYKEGLSIYDDKLFKDAATLYIIESNPIEYIIDEVKKEEALLHLEKVLINRKNGILDGISLEEANLILNSDIQNARVGLAKKSVDFFNNSLGGCCGLSQAATVMPLLELGIKTTINNVGLLPDGLYRHAFATCILPIKDGQKVEEKQFLLDATYRQFFLAIDCNKGNFYDGDYRFKDKTNPHAGYYVCKTKEGILFAKELLTKGYIELTLDNAKIYGDGFAMEKINLSTPITEQKKISSHTGKEYIEAINNKDCQVDLDYTAEELRDDGYNTSLYNHIGQIYIDDNKINRGK